MLRVINLKKTRIKMTINKLRMKKMMVKMKEKMILPDNHKARMH